MSTFVVDQSKHSVVIEVSSPDEAMKVLEFAKLYQLVSTYHQVKRLFSTRHYVTVSNTKNTVRSTAAITTLKQLHSFSVV